jgi:hypothetical protein
MVEQYGLDVLTMKTAATSNELTIHPPVKPFPLLLLKWNHRKDARPNANQVEKSDDTVAKRLASSTKAPRVIAVLTNSQERVEELWNEHERQDRQTNWPV